MDLLADPAFKLKYQKCKYKVKIWESEFFKANGRNPSKNDIRTATSQVRDAYKMYYNLKTLVLNDTLMELTFLDECVENVVPDPTFTDTNVKFEETVQNEKPVRAALKDKALNVDDNIKPKDQTICDNTSLKFDVKDSKNIWGKHLNKDLPNITRSNEKKKTLVKSASFNLSRKLFSGSTFNKRNPRKSLSFIHSNKETDVPSPSTFSESSQVSFSSELFNSQPIENNQSETEDNSSPSVSNDFPTSSTGITQSAMETSVDVKQQCITQTPTLVTGDLNFQNRSSHNISTLFSDKGTEMISTQRKVHNSTPISAVQRVLDSDNHGPIFSKKTINKGWLERCIKLNGYANDNDSSHTNTSCESHESTQKNRTLSNLGVTNQTRSSRTIESDEDLIYSSGDERETKSQQYKFSFKRKFSYEVKEPAMETNSASLDPPASSKRPKYLRKSHSEAEIKFPTVRDIDSAPGNLDEALSPQLDIEKLADVVVRNENSLNGKGGKPKRKGKLTKKDVLEKKMESGQANENFVKIDLKKKIYARGKKTMTYSKYKKAQWKKKKKGGAVYDGPSKELSTCFKCGDIGHWAGECKYTGDKLLPQEDESVIEESQFPTLEEVEAMCSEPLHADKRTTTQPLVSQNAVIVDPDNPGQAEILDCDQIISNSVEPLYKLKPDGSLIDTPREVYDALKLFGHESFRHGQEEAVMRILSGLSTLVTLSTGSGKSLVYQLSAYLMAQKSPCITLVVSPLVSLMEDQVVGVASCLKAACLHTNQTPKQRLQVMEQAKSGNLHILLVSPEAVVSGEKASGFGSILKELPAIGFACIDEAHCVSQWSHNFRPSYLVICKVLREKLGVKTVLGLTATATRETCDSIVNHLDIPDGLNGVINDIPLPDNLVLSVSKDENRDRALISLLQGERFKDFNSIIVYCTRQAECERIAAYVRTCLQDTKLPPSSAKKSSLSRNCEPYHAGLSASKRRQIQKTFMAGNLRIVVATVAFGMGINKADIRAVIHYNMPRNFESYVQEVGRAGRDGLPAHCHLFLDSRGGDQCELRRHIYADSVDRHTIRKLLQRIFVPCKCVQLTELLDGVDLSERFEDESTPSCERDEAGNFINPAQASKKLKVQCPGHEVAFDVDETIRALDLPKENIATMLCYLELHSRRWIKVMSPVYIMCKVLSYKGTRALKEAAKVSPPLAMAIALDQRRGISHEKSNRIEFPVVDIAALIGWDSGKVKHHLKNLEWKKDGEKWQRTSLTVEFTVLGFRVKAPGNLAPKELDNALDSLFARVNHQENKALLQLQTVFKALTSVAYPRFSACSDSADVGRSDDLKKQIRQYFEQDGSEAVLEVETSLANEDQIASDVRSLVCSYRDQTFTSRAVARIFHGISSPCFPAMVWSRNRYWRGHLDADFRLLCVVAAREILRLR